MRVLLLNRCTGGPGSSSFRGDRRHSREEMDNSASKLMAVWRVRRPVIADPEAVSVQRASARCHQVSVATTASPATGSGSSSWIVDTWLAAAAPPMPIHNAGAA
jgi:hypothetical protein